jgi:23S rRNA (adenine2503-C2)-methyltransferase
MTDTERTEIFGRSLDELRDLLVADGYDGYRAEQVFYWMYNRGRADFSAFSNLPKTLRETFAGRYVISHPQIIRDQQSGDGTRKMLFSLVDGRAVETVLIPSESEDRGQPKRLTLCVSTQIGCPLDCRFCATASMKLKRNLTSGEIIGQYLAAQHLSEQRITNLVYMGMGEPMLNYDAVMRSIDIITHEKTVGVSSSHITVSTAGLADGIRRMADERRKAKLAISLHATTDELRHRLMPINKKYPLNALIEAAEYYYHRMRRRITYEYILFDGINDGGDDIRRLTRLTRRVPSKVNLIPFHSISTAYPDGIPLDLRPTPAGRIEEFAARLRANNVTVMLRSSSGKDIDAACGQLAVRESRGL